MHGNLERGSGRGSEQDLQLGVHVEDLDAFRESREAQHLARLQADADLMFRLSEEGFGGRAWQEVARALAEYGHAVIRAWVITGQIFQRCRRMKGLSWPPASAAPRVPDPEEAWDLATDTVAAALVNFRDRVLAVGKWDPGM